MRMSLQHSKMTDSRLDDDYDDLDLALNSLDVDTNIFDEPVGDADEPATQLNPNESSGLIVAQNNECELTWQERKIVPYALLLVALGGAANVIVCVVMDVVRFWIPLLVVLLVVGLIARLCVPPRESFNAKKEMKRIKRGKHLDESQQQEQQNIRKNWLGKKVNRVRTFLVTEACNAVGAYDDVQFLDVGFGTITIVRDLTNGEYFSGMGAFGAWRVLDSWLSPAHRASLREWLWRKNRRRGPCPTA